MGLSDKTIWKAIQQHKENSELRVHREHLNRGCNLCEQAGHCVCGAEWWTNSTG